MKIRIGSWAIRSRRHEADAAREPEPLPEPPEPPPDPLPEPGPPPTEPPEPIAEHEPAHIAGVA